MQVAKEIVTPKKAMEWLKRNVANRPLSPKTVDRYKVLMTDKKWRLNGETIKFNGNGDLIDGQHRLSACVESGMSFECYVVRGLEHDTFDTIDQGKARTSGDVLARRGEKHYNLLAAAANVVYQISTTGKCENAGTVRPDQIVDTLELHPGIRDCVIFAMQHKHHAITQGSVVAGLLYFFRKVDKEKADLFWTRVCGGEGLTSNMPEFKLRSRLIDNKAALAKLRRSDICALAIKSWNNLMTGKSVKALAYFDREEFPKIYGLAD